MCHHRCSPLKLLIFSTVYCFSDWCTLPSTYLDDCVILADAELVCVLVAGLMDLCMQHSLVSRDTLLIGVRMVLKLLVAAGWIVIFSVFYRWGADELKDFNQFFRDEVVQCSNWCTFMYCFFSFSLQVFGAPGTRNWTHKGEWWIFVKSAQFLLGDYVTFCPYVQIHVEPATSWPCLDKGCQ
jgi:hypothetical protein